MSRHMLTMLLLSWSAGVLLGDEPASHVGGADVEPRPAAKDQDSPREREVTFNGAGGVRLAGTLLIPTRDRGAALPAVVLVAGSGALDRNGNAPGVRIDLLKQIAEALDQEGIASLRYDKRSIGASEQPPNEESLPEFTRWENFVGDAAAALAFLQDQPEVAPGRTAMIGHSEGGSLILQAAVEGQGFRHPPAALVLAATPGRRGDMVVRQQIARDPITAALLSRKNDEIMAAIRETGRVPDDVPPLLAPIYPPYLGSYLQSVLNFEGAAWASRFPGPVLVISGELDLNHVVAEETAALAGGLKQRQPDDHEVYIVRGASHNLKPVKSRFELGFEGALVPAAGAKLRSWLSDRLSPAAAQ